MELFLKTPSIYRFPFAFKGLVALRHVDEVKGGKGTPLRNVGAVGTVVAKLESAGTLRSGKRRNLTFLQSPVIFEGLGTGMICRSVAAKHGSVPRDAWRCERREKYPSVVGTGS